MQSTLVYTAETFVSVTHEFKEIQLNAVNVVTSIDLNLSSPTNYLNRSPEAETK